MRKTLRILLTAALTFVVFSYIIIPFEVKGTGLDPELKNNSWHILLKPAYLFSDPKEGDLVGISLAGDSVFVAAKIAFQPGEVIKVTGTKINLPNGVLLNVPKRYQDREIRLKDHEYFIFTENAEKETLVNGIVNSNRIIGRVVW